MKRKALLIIMLMAMFAPLAMFAQGNLTVCDGTETNQYIPFYAYSGDTQGTTSEFVIPERELTTLKDKEITGLKFYLSQSQSKTWTAVYQIYMAEAASTTLSGTIGPNNGTVVYEGTVDASGSEMTITFNQHYTYRGGNLLIGTYVKTAGAWDSYGKFYGISATSAAYLSGDWNGSSTGAKNFIPKTTFNYLSDDPYIILPETATVFISSTETITATYGNVEGTPGISYRSDNERVATVKGESTTAIITGVSAGTATITATMTYDGRDYTATCAVTVEEPHYCTPVYSQTSNNYGIWINGFSTTEGETNISTSSNGLSTNGYGDYYDSYSASAEAGQTIGFTVITANSVNPMIYSMWIDWNQDYDFDDAGEIVAQQTSGITTNWTGTIQIPATTPAGNYRIRIEGMYVEENSGVFNPCISATYGEAEDYQLIVLEAPDCIKPSNVQLSAIGNEVTVTWSGYASSYNISINGTVLPDPVTSPYVFTGEISTEYTIMVQSICSGTLTSDWSSSKSITTDACLFEDQCPITITLTDAYGDGGGSMYVVDANTESVLAELLLVGSASEEFQVYACHGAEIDFYFFATDSYAYENGYVITDPNGEVIAVHEGCEDSDDCTAPTDGVVASYTMNCSDCQKPSNLEANQIGTNSAVISWEGGHTKFDLQYGSVKENDFEEGLGAWTTIDADGDGFTWLWSGTITGVSGNNGSSYAAYSQSYDNDGEEVLYPDNYLVSPKVQLGGSISFYACGQDASWPAEHFGVAVSTSGNTNAADFTTIQEWTMTANGTGAKVQGTWGLFTVDLSAYSGEGYVAIRHFNCSDNFYLDVDDISIIQGSTIVTNITQNSYTLENLDEGTTYAVQVRGYCEGETNPTLWSNAISFTTEAGVGNVFVTEGDWNVAANWQGNAVPEAGSDVTISANVTVPANYLADAGKITVDNNATITIADGGQLKTTYGGVNATMQKTVNGYGSSNDGYVLLANPIKDALNPATLGMTAGEYDLYYFDLNCDGTYDEYGNVEAAGTDGLEWRNYKATAFDLTNGQGYLYANQSKVDLEFTGELYPTNTNIKVTMHYYASAEFPGMNLLGNPFSCNAYLADGRAFFVMDGNGGEIVPAGGNVIAPMQGIFVDATAVGNLNFTTTAPANNGKSALNINVTRQNKLVDRAVVSFGEGEGLRKFQLNPNHTKLYIPQENSDYAVVYSEGQGEMPVSFKAEKNGTYTLNFSNEEVEFNYLHLIDNLTGNEVDLLDNPSYSFEAKTTDYASRFKLVFATGNANSDNFAYFADGSLVINNEGNATMNVYDVTGRLVNTQSINGSCQVSFNAASGVYMIQLVNGNDTKTQKIVVK